MAKPSEVVGKAVGKLRAATQAMVDSHGGIFRKLAEEHAAMATMMSRVAGATDARVREELFPVIRRELLAHAHAESREFYDLLKQQPHTHDLAQHSEQEHREIEQLLSQLSSIEVTNDVWADLFQRLKIAVDHHVAEEEGPVFEGAKHVLDSERAKEIEARFVAVKKAEMQRLG